MNNILWWKQMGKKKTCEELPDLIEEIIPTWQQAVDDLNEKAKTKQLSASDIHLSIKLAETLMSVYIRYRTLKVELKEEAKQQSYKLTPQFQPLPLTAAAPSLNAQIKNS
jgi:hypothetical protein